MKRSRITNNGFAIVEGLLIAVLIGLVVLVGVYVWRARNSSSVALPSSSQASQSTDKYANWKELSSDIAFANLRYPPNWKVEEETVSQKLDDGSKARTRRTTITSPRGTVVHMYAADGGGGGGQCEPKPTDTPFTDGNECPSEEYLSSESLPIENLYHPFTWSDSESSGELQYAERQTEIVLTTKRYKWKNEETKYLITVAESRTAYPIKLKQPRMGYLTDVNELLIKGKNKDPNVTFWIYAEGKDAEFLTSKDAETVKNIFRSLQFNI